MVAIMRQAPTPQEACYQLVAAALQAGGPDNVTALVVEMVGDPHET
jgi:protein phosphatase